MSMIKNTVSIYPPLCDTTNTEHLRKSSFQCPTCAGEGVLRDPFECDNDKRCKRCNGTGSLVAEITIKWKPDDSIATS